MLHTIEIDDGKKNDGNRKRNCYVFFRAKYVLLESIIYTESQNVDLPSLTEFKTGDYTFNTVSQFSISSIPVLDCFIRSSSFAYCVYRNKVFF